MSGFIGWCYTQQSKAARRVHKLTAGVMIILQTQRTFEMAYDLSNSLISLIWLGVGN
jgi:hypothetical protein